MTSFFKQKLFELRSVPTKYSSENVISNLKLYICITFHKIITNIEERDKDKVKRHKNNHGLKCFDFNYFSLCTHTEGAYLSLRS